MLTSRRTSAHGSLSRARPRHRRASAAVFALALASAVSIGLFGAAPAASALGAALGDAGATARAETAEPAPGTPSPAPAAPRQLAPTETSTATPSPTPQPAAPTIESPAAGDFMSGSSTVSGTRDPSQEIQLLSPTGGDPLCILAADGSATWSCGVWLPSGPAVQLRAVVTGDAALSSTVTVRVLQAPAVTGGATGQPASNGMVRGTGYPGATATATLSGGQQCSFTVDASGAWACMMAGSLASGPVQVTATQRTSFSAPASSPASDPVTLQLDVDPPAAPSVTSPVAGATVPPGPAGYSGRGEDGTTVTVFAGPYSVCSAVVSGGLWSCSGGGVADGSYDLRAIQQDAAGNVSAGSPAIRVTYGQGPAVAGPAATAPPASSAAPVPPATSPPTTAPSATPAPATARPTAPGDKAEAVPPTLTVPGGWTDPTQFGTALIPPWTLAAFPWLQVVLITLGALILLLFPARLLAGTLSRARQGRPVAGRTLTGRNRAREEFEVAPSVRLSRWALGWGAVLTAAVFVLLSGPVTSTPAYLRLFVAVVLALVVVNSVATLIPQWWGSRALQLQVTTTVLPRYLAVVAVVALTSRALELHPALLFGLLGSVVAGNGPAVAERGRLAAIRAGSLLALGLVALLVVGTLPVADTFLSALSAEFANTVVLTAVGSAALVLVPVGSTSGRSILAWSPIVWAALAVPAFLTLIVLLSPVLPRWQGDGTALVLWLAAAVFACLSVAVWAWQRFVAPAMR